MIACDVFWPGVLGPCVLPCAGRAWTANDCCTPRAAAKRSSPAWEAITVQVPTAARVTVDPETVQTDGVPELKDTARPEVAEADRGTV